MVLLSYNYFCEAQHLLAQHGRRLNDVDDLAFFSSPAANRATTSEKSASNSFVQAPRISVTPLRRSASVNFCEMSVTPARSASRSSLFCMASSRHARRRAQAASQQAHRGPRSAPVHLLLERALAVVVELGLQADVLVLPLGHGLFERLGCVGFGSGFTCSLPMSVAFVVSSDTLQ